MESLLQDLVKEAIVKRVEELAKTSRAWRIILDGERRLTEDQRREFAAEAAMEREWEETCRRDPAKSAAHMLGRIPRRKRERRG